MLPCLTNSLIIIANDTPGVIKQAWKLKLYKQLEKRPMNGTSNIFTALILKLNIYLSMFLHFQKLFSFAVCLLRHISYNIQPILRS